MHDSRAEERLLCSPAILQLANRLLRQRGYVTRAELLAAASVVGRKRLRRAA